MGHCGTWLEPPCSLLRGVWRVRLWDCPGLARGFRIPHLKGSFAAGLGEQWGGGGQAVLQRPRRGGRACSRGGGGSVHVHECVPILKKGLLGHPPHLT